MIVPFDRVVIANPFKPRLDCRLYGLRIVVFLYARKQCVLTILQAIFEKFLEMTLIKKPLSKGVLNNDKIR
jgi:hypothetical protein